MNLRTPILILAIITVSLSSIGCSVAPKQRNQAEFRRDAHHATEWFKSNINGLDQQIAQSAGYAVYPAVGQWGIGISGGQFGRGVLNRPDGTQIGWAALNTASAGLQLGGRGYKLLVVFENREVLSKFMNNTLSGSATAVTVAGENGIGKAASFAEGVAVYDGDSTGLLAGANIGLNFMRYKELDKRQAAESSIE